MEDPNLTTLLASLNNYLTGVSNRINNANQGLSDRQSYTAGGLITNGPIKEWFGAVTSVNGKWTADISSAGFIQIYHVAPHAIFNGGDGNNDVTAHLNTVSLVAINGSTYNGNKKDAPNCTVMVKVTGR
ncbi:hypothetical protein D3C85_15500 [compost metagenome]